MSDRAELVRALAVCAEAPTPGLPSVVAALGISPAPTAAEHTDTFSLQLHPYASVHLGPEGRLGGIAGDRVAGFLRALDASAPTEPDHLATLLGAYAELLDRDEDGPATRTHHARAALFHEHLWPWVPRFAWRATEVAATPYRQWARLLAAVLADEAAELPPPPARLSAHLRDAPVLPDPRTSDPADFLAGLLAPVRSGLILTRTDMARAATELGLGLRLGERAFMLRSLLGQDASATLAFLAREAHRQHDLVPGDDRTATFWRARLASTAALLEMLATDGDR